MRYLLNIFSVFIVIGFWSGCSDYSVDKPVLGEEISTRAASLNTTDYYWHKGEQIGINKLDTKRYVLMTSSSVATVKQSTNIQFEVDPQKVTLSARIQPINQVSAVSSPTSDELMWGIVSTVYLSSIPDIVYDAPFFMSANEKELGLSHLYYVKLKDEADVNTLVEMANTYKVSVIGNNEFMPLWYTLSCTNESTGNALEMANMFYETGKFVAAQPDLMGDDSIDCVNDTNFDKQWHLKNSIDSRFDINFCEARTITKGSNTIVIAVLDQGIQKDHEDINNIYYKSYDCQTGTIPSQLHGSHGTECSSVIGATVNNNKGIAGIAPDCMLMDVSTSLTGTPDNRQRRADGINWAWRNGAAIISNSWGSGVHYQVIDDAIVEALQNGRGGKGTIIVFASGNSNEPSVEYPSSSHPDILAVGSITQSGQKSGFSSYGNGLDVVAPGSNIYMATRGGGYTAKSGTSYACPQVAAVAGLILSVNNSLTQKEVANIIEKTAYKLPSYSYFNISGKPNGTWNEEVGYGLIDTYAAVKMAQEMNYNNDLYLTDRSFSDYQSFFTFKWLYAQNVHVLQGGRLTLEGQRGIQITSPFSVHQDASFEMSTGL